MHFQTIFGTGKRKLGWTEDEIHAFAARKLRNQVKSLTDVGEQDLARLARTIPAESNKQ